MAKSHAHILYYRQRFDILLFLDENIAPLVPL